MLPIRILIIEDDPAGLLALSEALQIRIPDAVVDTAVSGHAGLAMLAGRVYDCIICDVMMPGIGGMDILDAVRERWPEVPIILVTAGDLERKNEALEKGVACFLPKPLNIGAVVNMVNLVTRNKPPGP